MSVVPFDCGRSYRYPREVWRPTRMESRCAFGPEAALPARTSDPAEDLRPHPRRHTVPVNDTLVLFRFTLIVSSSIVITAIFRSRKIKFEFSQRTISPRIIKNIRKRYLKFKFYREQNCSEQNCNVPFSEYVRDTTCWRVEKKRIDLALPCRALNFVKIIFNAFIIFTRERESRTEDQIGPSHISRFIFEKQHDYIIENNRWYKYFQKVSVSSTVN